jgi:hypothetical protein
MATDRLFNQTQGDLLLAILAQIRDGYNSVDGAFSLTSENPLQNKKITGAVTDIIETLGGTAQKSYAIGQYFLANDGYYYVATAAITAGSSNISSSTGGNCSKTCITAAMNNLSSQISNLSSNIVHNIFHQVNLPFTAPENGIIIFEVKIVSEGNWYDYYSISAGMTGQDGWIPQFCGHGATNGKDTRLFLLPKGATIKFEASNNITHIHYYFIYMG